MTPQYKPMNRDRNCPTPIPGLLPPPLPKQVARLNLTTPTPLSTHNSSSTRQPGCEAPAAHSKGRGAGRDGIMPGRFQQALNCGWLQTQQLNITHRSTSRSIPQSTLISHTRCSLSAVVVVTGLLVGPSAAAQTPVSPLPPSPSLTESSGRGDSPPCRSASMRSAS